MTLTDSLLTWLVVSPNHMNIIRWIDLKQDVWPKFFETKYLNPLEKDRSYSSIWANDSIGSGHARSMLDSG